MATVREYMNRELVYLRKEDRAELALIPILDFGLTAVPVLEEDHRPVGVVSIRDLADPRRAAHRVTVPARTIDLDAPIEAAARVLVEAGLHHLVVVDANGCAVGMLSAADVLRAMLDMPPKHPAAFTEPKRQRLHVP